MKQIQKLDFDYLLTGHSLRPVPRERLKDFIGAAMNPDIERARKLRPNEFAPGVTPLRCFEKKNPEKSGHGKNKARIVISRDKLL